MITVPQDDPNLIVGFGVRSMKKISFFSVYDAKDKANSPVVFSDLTKNIRSLKFLPWSRSPFYKLIGSSGSQILIIDLTMTPSPQMTVSRNIGIFTTATINDFAVIETTSSSCDLLCLSSERQLGRVKQFEKLL